MLNKPTWGLRKEVNEDKHDRRGKELNASWTTPLCLAFDEEEAIVNELAACHAGGLQATFDHDPNDRGSLVWHNRIAMTGRSRLEGRDQYQR